MAKKDLRIEKKKKLLHENEYNKKLSSSDLDNNYRALNKLTTWGDIYKTLGLEIDDKEERRKNIPEYDSILNEYVKVFGNDFVDRINLMFKAKLWGKINDRLIISNQKVKKYTSKRKAKKQLKKLLK